MYILGIETSCDETGIAVYDSQFWRKDYLLSREF
jgi:N6-L-threonylcarbamoyladenine synthase